MHTSSYAKMASFFRVYGTSFPRTEGVSIVLDVGSRSFSGQRSYKDFIDPRSMRYVGLDLEAGENVDIVASSGYVWPEIEDETISVCISGQTFEHNPFFWATMAEVSRVLVPGGLACVIAPGAQGIHRFPVDCWRFYPDSWAALCSLTGLNLLEAYFETDDMALRVRDGAMRDSMMIAVKAERTDSNLKRRLNELVEPFKKTSIEVKPLVRQDGPCVEDYKRTAPKAIHWRARLAQAIYPFGPVKLFRDA